MKTHYSYLTFFFCFAFSFANAQDESTKTFIGNSEIWTICFSPNGKQLASGNSDNTIKLYDVISGQNIRTFFGHKGWVNSVCFSSDNKFIASGSMDSTIKLWTVLNGHCIKTFRKHSGSIESVRFSPDNKYLASGSIDKTIKLWNIANGQVVKTFSGHTEDVKSICFSYDGKYLASGSEDNTLKLWDVTSGKNLKTFIGHKDIIWSVCISHDGKYLASASRDNTIKLWDVTSGKNLKTFIGHTGNVYSIDFSPDGKYLVSGSEDNILKLWEIKNGQNIRTFTGHNGDIFSVCFSPDGKLIASGSFDKTIKLWEVFSVKEKIKNYVENKITSWQQKGEFEKSTDYALRVSEENRKQKIAQFQKQCIDELALAEERKIYESYKNFNLQKFDADAETYLIDANTYGNLILKIPLANAPEFKENWKLVTVANPHFEFTGEDFVLTHLDFLISDKKKFSYDISEKYMYTNLNIEYKFNPVQVDLSGKKVDAQNPNISQKNIVFGKADIDYFELIPQTKTQNPDAIAVVIGNSNYAHTKSVTYATNDAQSIKTYLIKTLGFKEGNILFKEDATLGDFNTLFGTKDNQRGRLANTIKEGISDVFIFYSGHGAPGLKDNKGYFVPVECDPNYVENSGYQLDVFYQNLAQLKAKSVTIILDACFSGTDVFENISPIVIRVKDPILLIPNAVIIASSSGTEVSTWYEEKEHGMFTYFFLKAIQDKEHSDKNKDGQLTFDEMYNYVSNKNEGVPYYARRIHGIEQTPTIMGDRKDKVFIKY